MPSPADTPTFFELAQSAWIKCDEARDLGQTEIACLVTRLTGGKGLIISPRRFVSSDRAKIWALVIGEVPSGNLVDFPSGDRMAVPRANVEILNGSPV